MSADLPRFGRPRHHHEVTDSTNERARELASEGAPHGTLVSADEQTAGRGRSGRRWSAPAGTALLCSAILRPLAGASPLLPLAVPLAVCEAAESLADTDCRVKWPNDVWVEQKKLAGVLIEAHSDAEGGWAVIGVGLNLAIAEDEFPDDLRWPATSVSRYGETPSADDALAALCPALDRWTVASAEEVRAEFARRDALRGREIGWEGAGGRQNGNGITEGIDSAGNLLVRTPDGDLTALSSGEVQLRL